MGANEPGQPPLTSSARIADWSEDIEPPTSALAIGAHPDDVEFGCGGTLAKWAAAGCVVHHLVLTDGSKGTWDADADLPALVTTRQEEQRAAAAALGGRGEVIFLGQVDGELDHSRSLTSEVARWIRALQPSVVLGHDPWKRYRLHPDHRAAGFLTCDAIVGARDPHFFTEHGIVHHRPDTLLLWEADEPDHAESLGDAAVSAKLAALEAHASQFESTMGAVDADQLAAFRSRVIARLAESGARIGKPAAEIFKRITDL
ncbi:MAG: PIG-L deacetylase family protein [Acidimicrobiia bacterium]